jgi:ubiquinol-cytochrome c reductase cytochrome c1 subunit
MFAIPPLFSYVAGASAVTAVGAGIKLSLSQTEASSDALHVPAQPWNHNLPWESFDYRSIRRGFQVYKNVCANCHSLNALSYRHLVNTCYSAEEVEKMAADTEVVDGPNDEGEMFERPGKVSDYMPKPYANKEAAKFANNGAYPPDLSVMVKARFGGEDYVYSLLTGYRPAPAGIELKEGLHFNPYFPGGAIGMAQALMNGQVEYDDGTEATISQMAKDVTTFLCWVGEPQQDQRKLAGLKAFCWLAFGGLATLYFKRFKWTFLKNRRFVFTKPFHPTKNAPRNL